ncbi:MAG: hypothetical protein JOY68_10215 [Candidatus Dormibacteraeota bacterium]|nr:hypothetical protein [Candidatus Dormibacteraeota bacterium]
MGDSNNGDEARATGEVAPSHSFSRRALIGLSAAAGGAVLGSRVLNPSAAAAQGPIPKDGGAASDPSLNASVLFGYTGEGPNGAEFDRVRLLTGKLPSGQNISSGAAVGSTSITLAAAPSGLQPGQPVLLSGGVGETVYTAASYAPGANPVQLASPIQHGGHVFVTYDVYSPTGPRAQDFTPYGVLPVACAITEGINGRYTLMLGAGLDQGPPINTVMVSPSLVSGPAAQMDRQRSLSNVGDGLGVALASPPSSRPLFQQATNAAATVTIPAVSGQHHRLTMIIASYSATPTGGQLEVKDGGTTILVADLVAAGAEQLALPPGGIIGSVNTAMTVNLSAGGGGVVGSLSVATLTA